MKKIILATLAIVLLASCRKEIDLKLKDTDPQFVIESVVTAGDSLHYVLISKTISFTASNVFPGVTGATVSVVDANGKLFPFAEVSPGRYENYSKEFEEGQTYRLTVIAEGQTFQAESKIPKIVPLLGAAFLPNQFFGNDGLLMVPVFEDEANVRNYYTFQYRDVKKDDKVTDLIIRDDEFSDGQFNQQPLFEGFELEEGDTILLEMSGIDASLYKYYFSKIQNTDPNSGAPANPVTNLTNNALGYFSARNKQAMVLIVE